MNVVISVEEVRAFRIVRTRSCGAAPPSRSYFRGEGLLSTEAENARLFPSRDAAHAYATNYYGYEGR